jgi:hypothetical protein
VSTNTDGSVARPLLLDATQPRGELAVHPTNVASAEGERLVPDPACKTCHGEGRYVAGYSGRDDDGNAPIWEDCDCFIPADACPVCGEAGCDCHRDVQDVVRTMMEGKNG